MPTLSQFEEIVTKLLKQFEKRQQRLSNLQTLISLLAGWLIAGLITPEVLRHALHLVGL